MVTVWVMWFFPYIHTHTHTHTAPRALIYGLSLNPQLFSCEYENCFSAVGGWLMVGIFAVCLVGKTVGT